MNAADKLKSILKNEGISGALKKLFRKLIYRRQTIVVIKKSLLEPHRRFKTSKRWSTRQFTEDDLQYCRSHFHRYINDYKDLFRDKYTAFAAFEQDTNEVIAIAWYSPRDFYDQHYHHFNFSVEPYQVFQFAGEVAPDYRNTQVSVNVMHAGWDYWKNQGKEEVLCTIDVTNIPSLKLCFHLEWEELGKLIHFHRLFRVEWQTRERYQGERFAAYKKKHRRQPKQQAATG